MSLRSTYQKDKGQAPSGGGAARTRSTNSSAPSSGGSSEISDKQIDAVRTMQRIMGKLEEELAMTDVAQTAAQKLNNPEITADYIMQNSRSWGATSAGGTSGSYDGRWGKNTKGSLQKIQDFVKEAKIKNVIIQVGDGTHPFREMSEDDVIKMANDNITNLGRLFVELGRSAPKEVNERGGAGYILDKVSESLDNTMVGQNPWPESYGTYPVTAGDIKDIGSFFYFIQGIRYTDCKPLSSGKKEEQAKVEEVKETKYNFASLPESSIEKFAREILDGSIFKIAQQPSVEEVKPVEENVAENLGDNGVCFNVIEDMLAWFSRRARMVYEQLNRGYEKAEPYPLDPNRVVGARDVEISKYYMGAVRNLHGQWASIRGKVLKELENRNMHERPVVTLEILAESLGGGVGENARGASSGGGAARRRDVGGGYTVPAGTYQNVSAKGPIDNYMELESLATVDGFRAAQETVEKLKSLTKGNELPSIDMREWRSGTWRDIAFQWINAQTQTEQLRLFPEWATNVGRLVTELFRYWQDDIRGTEKTREERDALFRAQQTMLGRWQSYIRSMIADAQRNMSDEIARVNTGKPARSKYV